MTAITKVASGVNSEAIAIFTAGFIGVAMLFVAGFANSATLHDAAHDTRHAAGFPCH